MCVIISQLNPLTMPVVDKVSQWRQASEALFVNTFYTSCSYMNTNHSTIISKVAQLMKSPIYKISMVCDMLLNKKCETIIELEMKVLIDHLFLLYTKSKGRTPYGILGKGKGEDISCVKLGVGLILNKLQHYHTNLA